MYFILNMCFIYFCWKFWHQHLALQGIFNKLHFWHCGSAGGFPSNVSVSVCYLSLIEIETQRHAGVKLSTNGRYFSGSGAVWTDRHSEINRRKFYLRTRQKLHCIVGGGIKVHSTLRPLNGLLCQPWVIMIMEKSVEWLEGETEVPGENLPQCRFVHHKPHMLPVREPGLPRWEASV
jgi:hypothetical protein